MAERSATQPGTGTAGTAAVERGTAEQLEGIPTDAAITTQPGAVGSGISTSGDPAQGAAAIVRATTSSDAPDVIAEVSRALGEPMVGIDVATLPGSERHATRGW